LQVFIGDPELCLHASQLDVIARNFGEARNQRIAALVGRLLDPGVRRFDLPAHATPQIEFPGSIKPDGIFVEWENIGTVPTSGGGRERRQQAEDAVLAVKFALVLGIAVDAGEFRGGDDAALEPAFRQTDCCGLDVEIGFGDALLQAGQNGIAKFRPPRRIRRLKQPRIKDFA
jgi:hypothetical protein